MAILSKHDIRLDSDGDVYVDAQGNIESSSSIEGLKNSVMFRVQTSIKDWIYDPDFCADIDRFIGAKNDEVTGKAIENNVRNVILRDFTVNSQDLKVNVVPISNAEVVLFVEISNINTDDGSSGIISIQFKIDFANGAIVTII